MHRLGKKPDLVATQPSRQEEFPTPLVGCAGGRGDLPSHLAATEKEAAPRKLARGGRS
jgi:hypothetical protein